jgi:hypothetical protein
MQIKYKARNPKYETILNILLNIQYLNVQNEKRFIIWKLGFKNYFGFRYSNENF